MLFNFNDEKNKLIDLALKDKILNNLTNSIVMSMIIILVISYFIADGLTIKSFIHSFIFVFMGIMLHDYGIKQRNKQLKTGGINEKFSSIMTKNDDDFANTIDELLKR